MPVAEAWDGAGRHRHGDPDWAALPVTGSTATRGTGVVDLARAIRAGEPHRATGDLALHVLETMLAIDRSAATGGFAPVHSGFTQPELLAPGWDPRARTLAARA